MSSTDKVILTCLQVLAERESWRANDLPQGCTLNVLRVLDRDGLILFHLWERADPNPRAFENPDPKMFVAQRQRYTGWFSPFNNPAYGVDVSDLLPKDGDDPELATEIIVSKFGTAKLAEREIAAQAEEDPGASKTGQGGTPLAEAKSNKLVWSEDDPEFLHNKEAVAISQGKISDSVLSKLLTPTGPIRHMRKGQRCKVHIGDFMRHLSTMAGGLSENEASDLADEFLSSKIEERKVAEREKRASGR